MVEDHMLTNMAETQNCKKDHDNLEWSPISNLVTTPSFMYAY